MHIEGTHLDHDRGRTMVQTLEVRASHLSPTHTHEGSTLETFVKVWKWTHLLRRTALSEVHGGQEVANLLDRHFTITCRKRLPW